MNRASRVIIRLLMVSSIATGVAGGATACVSGDSYALAKRDAENARLLYQSEQRQAQELAANNKRLKQQLEELDAALKETRDKLARSDREWREARDELLRLKIEREQRRTSRDGESQLNLDTAKPDADVRPKPSPQSDESKRRLKELLEQLHGLLQQY
jgi:septal ring factor EnvC (AmiA/AmiB activator)